MLTTQTIQLKIKNKTLYSELKIATCQTDELPNFILNTKEWSPFWEADSRRLTQKISLLL
jgi:hypothetical protein